MDFQLGGFSTWWIFNLVDFQLGGFNLVDFQLGVILVKFTHGPGLDRISVSGPPLCRVIHTSVPHYTALCRFMHPLASKKTPESWALLMHPSFTLSGRMSRLLGLYQIQA